jgi:hypothetical protein
MIKNIFENKEKVKDVFKKLPDELKSYILSFENTQKISGIIIENELPQEIQSEFSFLISLVLTGINSKKEFEDNLIEYLGVDSLLASKIYIQVDREIFYPVKKLINKAREIAEKEIELEKKEEEEEKIEKKEELEKKKEEELKKEEKVAPKSFKWETIEKKVSPKVILGKEKEIEPTLETSSPFTSIFKKIKPKKEKIVSALEVEKKEEEKEKVDKKSVGLGGIFSKIKETFIGEEVKEKDEKIGEEVKETDKKEEEKKEIDKKPVKIVNFPAEEIKPRVEPEMKPKIETEMKPKIETEMKPKIETEMKPRVETGIKQEMKPEIGLGMKQGIKPEMKMERMKIIGREEKEEKEEIGKVEEKKDDNKIELKKLKF